jgi:hypothetical protein
MCDLLGKLADQGRRVASRQGRRALLTDCDFDSVAFVNRVHVHSMSAPVGPLTELRPRAAARYARGTRLRFPTIVAELGKPPWIPGMRNR